MQLLTVYSQSMSPGWSTYPKVKTRRGEKHNMTLPARPVAKCVPTGCLKFDFPGHRASCWWASARSGAFKICSTRSGESRLQRHPGARRGAARRALPGSARHHACCHCGSCEAPRAVTARHSRSSGWAPKRGWLQGPGAPSAAPPAPARPRRAAAVTGATGPWG